MRLHRLVILLFLFGGWPSVAVFGQAGKAAPARQPAKGPDLTRVVEQINDLTNRFRVEEKRAKVTVNAKLTQTAQDFADFMARTGKYGHEADGQTPSERAQKQGYEYCLISENIAYFFSSAGFKTAELSGKFVQGWKDSPGHRKNMLDPDVTETGVAVARSPTTGYYYAVQMFGRPRSLQIEFTIANPSDATIRYTVGDQSFELPSRKAQTHQICRPSDVTFEWPDAAGKAGQGGRQTVRPGNGERYTVVKGSTGEFSARKE